MNAFVSDPTPQVLNPLRQALPFKEHWFLRDDDESVLGLQARLENGIVISVTWGRFAYAREADDNSPLLVELAAIGEDGEFLREDNGGEFVRGYQTVDEVVAAALALSRG